MDKRIATIQKNFEKCQQTLDSLQKEKIKVKSFMKQMDGQQQIIDDPLKSNISKINQKQLDFDDEILDQIERLFEQIKNNYQVFNIFNQQFIDFYNFKRQLNSKQYDQLLLKMINFSVQLFQQQQNQEPLEQKEFSQFKLKEKRRRINISESSDSDDEDYYRNKKRNQLYSRNLIQKYELDCSPQLIDLRNKYQCNVSTPIYQQPQHSQPNINLSSQHIQRPQYEYQDQSSMINQNRKSNLVIESNDKHKLNNKSSKSVRFNNSNKQTKTQNSINPYHIANKNQQRIIMNNGNQNQRLYNDKGQIDKHYDIEDIPKQRVFGQNHTIRPVIEQQNYKQ